MMCREPIVVDRWPAEVGRNSSVKSGLWIFDGFSICSIWMEKYYSQRIQMLDMALNDRVGIRTAIAPLGQFFLKNEGLIANPANQAFRQ